MSFFAVDSEDFRSVGEVMMSWAAVETVVSMSLRNLAGIGQNGTDDAVPAKVASGPLKKKLKWLGKRVRGEESQDAIHSLLQCVAIWKYERDCLAHGMLVVGPEGKSWVTDQGKRLPHSQIPAAVRHSQVAYKHAYVIYLHSVGEPVTKELLEQPVIRIEDGLPVPSWQELQHWLRSNQPESD